MNRNLRFGIEIAVFVLIAALLITDICFHLPGRSSDTPQVSEGTDTGTGTEETVNYLPDGTEKTPEEKFGRYTHIQKKTATLFTPEEAAAWAEWRASGERYGLTEEEIEYLISDTVELYLTYSTIQSDADQKKMTYLPYWNYGPFEIQHGVKPNPKRMDIRAADLKQYDKVCREIYQIILYRMEMFSCREAFITERDIARFAGTKNATDNPIWYIPYLSDDTNRDEILAACAGMPGSDGSLKDTLIELTVQPKTDLFRPYVLSLSAKNGERTEVFPTARMKEYYDIVDTEYYLSKGPSYNINLLVFHFDTWTAEIYRLTDGKPTQKCAGTLAWDSLKFNGNDHRQLVLTVTEEDGKPLKSSEEPYTYAFFPLSDQCQFVTGVSRPTEKFTITKNQTLLRIRPDDPDFPKGVIEP